MILTNIPCSNNNVPVGQHATAPDRLGRQTDGLSTFAILPDTDCPVLSSAHKPYQRENKQHADFISIHYRFFIHVFIFVLWCDDVMEELHLC